MKITLCTKGLPKLDSACLSVTTIYSIYSLQVKTMCNLAYGGFILQQLYLYGIMLPVLILYGESIV
jgi:hypothetical protein